MNKTEASAYINGVVKALLEVKQNIFNGMTKRQLVHWINAQLNTQKKDENK
jgi:hypothetical protein